MSGEAGGHPGDLTLPTPPGVIRRHMASHPRRMDSTLALIYLGFNLLIVSAAGFFVAVRGTVMPSSSPTPTFTPVPSPTNVVGITVQEVESATSSAHPVAEIAFYALLVIVVAGAMWFRRRWVIPSALTILTACAVQSCIITSFEAFAACTALYALAVYRSARWGWFGCAIGTGLHALFGAAWNDDPSWVGGAISICLLYLAATAIFTNIGNRRRYTAGLIEIAETLARERDQRAQLAVAAERTRIAREMHDVVSHSLTVMVTLADGALAQLDRSPTQARAALEALAETGRGAAGEMRRMLGVLRDTAEDPDVREPQPQSADIWTLVEGAQLAGLPARIQIAGVAPQEPGVQLAAYRVVQESLTNALRYAHGATEVVVRLASDDERYVVEVSDNGRASGFGQVNPKTAAQLGGGNGIVGLRERVSAYGGSLEAGPLDSGGWRVRAELPLHPEQ